MTPEELSERLLEFAARVGKVVDAIPDTRLDSKRRHEQFSICNSHNASIWLRLCLAALFVPLRCKFVLPTGVRE